MHLLPALEINPDRPADAVVIWLHGLGADGHDFAPIVPELNLPPNAAVRFIFPHAPSRPVTINAGYVMPAWYDILEMSLDRRVDVGQLEASAAAIAQCIDREIASGIASERIVVAGFSQGGAVGYQVALTYPQPLAGLLAMSTYFATADAIKPNAANQQLPIHIYHGSFDPVVPESLGRKAYNTLTTRGYPCEYRTYPMEHSVSAAEIADIGASLRSWLAN